MSFDDLYRNMSQLLDNQTEDFSRIFRDSLNLSKDSLELSLENHSKTSRDHVQIQLDQQNLSLDRLDAKLDQVIDLLTTPVELRVIDAKTLKTKTTDPESANLSLKVAQVEQDLAQIGAKVETNRERLHELDQGATRLDQRLQAVQLELVSSDAVPI